MGRSIFFICPFLFTSPSSRVHQIDFNIMDVLDWPNSPHDFFIKISWILFGAFISFVILKQITAYCILTLFVVIRAFYNF